MVKVCLEISKYWLERIDEISAIKLLRSIINQAYNDIDNYMNHNCYNCEALLKSAHTKLAVSLVITELLYQINKSEEFKKLKEEIQEIEIK
jgi:hypothetical protein